MTGHHCGGRRGARRRPASAGAHGEPSHPKPSGDRSPLDAPTDDPYPVDPVGEQEDANSVGAEISPTDVHTDVAQQQAPEYRVGYGNPPLEGRFKKGVSGNPGGRRKGSDTRAVLRRLWAANPNALGEGQLAVDHAIRLIEALMKRDHEALDAEIKVLHEICGKPTEKIEQEITNARRVILRVDAGQGPPPGLPGEGETSNGASHH